MTIVFFKNTIWRSTKEEYFTYSFFQMSHIIALIGSTGSVGRQTLDVIRNFPAEAGKPVFEVKVLAARGNIDLLSEQIEEFRPKLAVVYGEEKARGLRKNLEKKQSRGLPARNTHALDVNSTLVESGPAGLLRAAVMQDVDTVFFASSGVEALPALYAAIKAKKRVALANKEMIVEEGEKIMRLARENGAEIIPVDSEHSAIFQCLRGENPADIEKIILTCSGGPFYGKNPRDLEKITPAEAVRHPVWKMGAKISVDSATLMNKAFEIIEAKHLFGLNENQIEVLIHPEGIVHSLVQFKDGSVKAQMGVPDMKIPITCALMHPHRIQTPWPRIDFSSLSKLTFIKPDLSFFRGPDLARTALKKGRSSCALLRRANDEAVQKFLSGELAFTQIYPYIKRVTAL